MAYLVHAEPEWIVTKTPDPTLLSEQKLDKTLENSFDLGPMNENRSFPNKCPCSGCAIWAVKSSTRFVDAFSAKVGISQRFEEYSKFPLGFEFDVKINTGLLLEQK